jgi:hypothetical protein
VIKEADIEETNRSHDYLLTEHTKELKDYSILFTTNHRDEKYNWVKGTPVTLAVTNIHSMMGGRVNLWENSANRIGICNPYNSKDTKVKHNFGHQRYEDDILEFNSLYSVVGEVLGRGYRLAQDKGPFELKFKDTVIF